MNQSIYFFINRLIQLLSGFAFIVAIIFITLNLHKASYIWYLVEFSTYFLFSILWGEKEWLRKIVIFSYLYIALALMHIAASIFFIEIALNRYMTLFSGILTITSIFILIMNYFVSNKKSIMVGFVVYFIFLILLGVSYNYIFEKYSKRAWMGICTRGVKDINQYRDLNGFCSCMYEKFKKRYHYIENFPSPEIYKKVDRLDIMNCTIEYLVKDTVNKDSIKLNMLKKIEEQNKAKEEKVVFY